MCVPHGMGISRSNGYEKEDNKTRKSVKMVSKKEFEKGDPDFVDERKKTDESEKKKSFLDSLFNLDS